MGKHTYSVAVNEFADMTLTEFHSKMTGLKPTDATVLRAANEDGPHKHLKEVAASVDWRAKNAVTSVKNQQQCGSETQHSKNARLCKLTRCSVIAAVFPLLLCLLRV